MVIIPCNPRPSTLQWWAHLKQHSAVFLESDPLAVSQGQKTVVVHDGVHVLHPEGIHIAVIHDVLPLDLHGDDRNIHVAFIVVYSILIDDLRETEFSATDILFSNLRYFFSRDTCGSLIKLDALVKC